MNAEYMTLDEDEYQEMKELLENSGYEVDKNAFACIMEEEAYVMLREGFVESVNNDELQVVIAHEVAHLNGVMDEEDADRWALEQLGENSQEILKDMWEERHGHEYNESKQKTN